MEKVEDIKGYTVAEWEYAVSRRPEMRLEELRIHKGKVVGATGLVLTPNIGGQVSWLWDGRAYFGNTRMQKYDLKFQ